jgi:hypothetical protein
VVGGGFALISRRSASISGVTPWTTPARFLFPGHAQHCCAAVPGHVTGKQLRRPTYLRSRGTLQ